MKINNFIIGASVVVCALALTAFGFYPSTPDGDKQKKEQVPIQIDNDVDRESTAPCACSKYSCSHGHALEFSAKAYKKYSGKKCSYCKGSGRQSDGSTCYYCEGDGLDWSWESGCVCKKCEEVYNQPNDC